MNHVKGWWRGGRREQRATKIYCDSFEYFIKASKRPTQQMHNITENPQPYEGWPAQLGGLSLLFTVKLFYDLKSGWVSGRGGDSSNASTSSSSDSPLNQKKIHRSFILVTGPHPQPSPRWGTLQLWHITCFVWPSCINILTSECYLSTSFIIYGCYLVRLGAHTVDFCAFLHPFVSMPFR